MTFENLKKTSATLVIMFLLAFTFLPAFAHAVEAEDTTGKGTGITYECGTTGKDGKIVYGNCDFNDLILAVKKAIKYIVTLTLSFSVVVIAFAGYKYMMSGDNATERREANQMLTKVGIGIFFILAAWLMVTLITGALLTNDVKELVPLGK